MTEISEQPTGAEVSDAERIALSVLAGDGGIAELRDLFDWFVASGERIHATAKQIPLEHMAKWRIDEATGNIAHESGGFFVLEGLAVDLPGQVIPHWTQPIINQPEVGVLGLLAKQFDGVPHFLVQAKAEPGNRNGVQISPTVQATRSNYTRVHGGTAVPYLDFFLDAQRHRVLTDVRQSEQGAWFYQKRNRNMVVEVTGDVEVLDGFRWVTLGQLHRLLAMADVVNMDTRTVLSCLPFAGVDLSTVFTGPADDFRTGLIRSAAPDAGVHSMRDVLHWITDRRARTSARLTSVPLRDLDGWVLADGQISHESGYFFDVIGVEVRAGRREVTHWAQPMIRPVGTGVIGLLVTRLDGVVHALMHAHIEPGYVDMVELAPTVQCTPENYEYLPAEAKPEHLDRILTAPADRVRFDTVLSEEGGRFYHARNRYIVVEVDAGTIEESDEYRWLSVGQLVELLRHSYYVNVQARSLIACLHSLVGEGRA